MRQGVVERRYGEVVWEGSMQACAMEMLNLREKPEGRGIYTLPENHSDGSKKREEDVK